MYIQLVDSKGTVIYSTIPNELKSYCLECHEENENFFIGSKKYRHGKTTSAKGSVYAITDEPDTVSRNRYFRERLKSLGHLLPIVGDIQQKTAIRTTAHTKRLVHNLESLNGHNIQELYNLVSEQELRETPTSERKKIIEQKIKERQTSIHKTILNLVKNNASMKMEFSVFNKLMTGKVGKIEKQPHPLRRAFLNVAHIFFQDFGEKGIDIIVGETDRYVFVDYECFQVSFYQLLDNATKYVLRDTDVIVDFVQEDKYMKIVMTMLSVKIEDDEIDKIMQDGYCGKNAKKMGASGKGIGMLNVKQTLELNGGGIKVVNNVDKDTILASNIPYEKNRFIITLPIYQK